MHDQLHAALGTRGIGQECFEHSAGLAHVIAVVRHHHVEHEASEASGVRPDKGSDLLAKAEFAGGPDEREAEIAVGTAGAAQDELRIVGAVRNMGQTDRGEEGIARLTLQRPKLGPEHARHACSRCHSRRSGSRQRTRCTAEEHQRTGLRAPHRRNMRLRRQYRIDHGWAKTSGTHAAIGLAGAESSSR